MFGLFASDGYVPIGSSTVVDDTAAALWLPAGTTLGDDVWDPLSDKLAVALDGELERIATLAGMFEEVHPSDTDHWYLLAIGFDSRVKARGLVGCCSSTPCGSPTSGANRRISRRRAHAVGTCTSGTASR